MRAVDKVERIAKISQKLNSVGQVLDHDASPR
jgi:hypothetical protein